MRHEWGAWFSCPQIWRQDRQRLNDQLAQWADKMLSVVPKFLVSPITTMGDRARRSLVYHKVSYIAVIALLMTVSIKAAASLSRPRGFDSLGDPRLRILIAIRKLACASVNEWKSISSSMIFSFPQIRVSDLQAVFVTEQDSTCCGAKHKGITENSKPENFFSNHFVTVVALEWTSWRNNHSLGTMGHDATSLIKTFFALHNVRAKKPNERGHLMIAGHMPAFCAGVGPGAEGGGVPNWIA